MRAAGSLRRQRLSWRRLSDGRTGARSFYGELQAGPNESGFQYFVPWGQLRQLGYGPFETLAAAQRAAERRMRERLRDIAHHEAAHVVLALMFRLPLRPVAAQLVPASAEDWRAGRTNMKAQSVMYDGTAAARRDIENGLVMYLAGAAAHRRLGASYDGSLFLASDDYEHVRDVIDAVLHLGCDDEPDPWRWSPIARDQSHRQYLGLLESRTELLVRRPSAWRAIRTVAARLLATGQIARCDAVAILARAV